MNWRTHDKWRKLVEHSEAEFVAVYSKISTIVYDDTGRGIDGIFATLPNELATIIEFDALSLEEQPTSKRVTLWFRQGARAVFHIRFVRKSGRCLVEIGGLDAKRVLVGIHICKQHFDQWFNISKRDIRSYD